MKAIDKAKEWLDPYFDAEVRAQAETWIANDDPELEESFYKDLSFGTGGMRGVMGVGTNRINKYTIAKATLGLANYLKQELGDNTSVAIAHDSRNNSSYFARIAAGVLAAEGIKALLFPALRPTPLLSYALREKNCDAGIVITASHNPKEYNGYKVYWNDGGQLVAPQDKGVMQAVNAIERFDQISFDGPDDLIEELDDSVDAAYVEEVKQLIAKNAGEKDAGLKIVYTNLHGTGITMIPRLMKELGFNDFHTVPEQDEPDGNFPSVESPNPEERSALSPALKLGSEIDAELILGTDPDTDRVGLAIRDDKNEWLLLNGNQAAAILVHYFLNNLNPEEKDSYFVCKTIVTTKLLADMSAEHGVECIDTLTGFKYIAEQIRLKEGEKKFLCGGEESFGYLAGSFVRDKDAALSAVLFAQIAAECKAKGSDLYSYLLDIYNEYGLYKQRLVSMTKKGKAGLEEIQQMISDYRNDPPKELAGEKLVEMMDYSKSIRYVLNEDREEKIDLESSNVLQFLTEKGSLVTVRPSGTEPKIKFYFSIKQEIGDSIESAFAEAESRLDRLEKAFI